MFRSYLVAALGNLARNRLYTLISVGGLAVAFTAALLIAIFVGDEFSYDKWIPGAKDVYRVSNTANVTGSHLDIADSMPPDAGRWMRVDFPQIGALARLFPEQRQVRHGRTDSAEMVTWSDPELFTVLPLPTIAGDLKTALARPDGVVLNRTLARKYFGTDNPVGQTLLLDGHFPLTVTAVIEDLPSNTHLRLSMVASGKAPFSELSRLDSMPTDGRVKPWGAYVYFRLRPGQPVQPIADRMPAFLKAHMPGYAPKIVGGPGLSFQIYPITRIHFLPRALSTMKPRGDLTATGSVAGVGVLIVLMAAINFVNLMTARAGRRAVEVGVRKMAGAKQRDLVIQFIGEALIYATLAAVIAFVLTQVLMPPFNAFLGRQMAFPYILALPVLAGLVLLIGVLAGSYPALILSSFRPAAALKGAVVQGSGSAALRQGLVALQFAVLIGLVVSTVVIWRQTVFATRESLRLDSDQMLLIRARCMPDALEQQIAALPGVKGVACSMMAPVFNTFGVGAQTAKGQDIALYSNSIGFDFFELYGLKPLAGRFFSKAHGGDATSVADDREDRVEAVVINQTAMHTLGFSKPADAIGKTFGWTHIKTMDGIFFKGHPARIIGVVEDFPMNSIRSRIEPTSFYVEPDQQTYINVKLRGRDIPETMKTLEGLWRKTGHPGKLDSFFLDRMMQDRYRDVTLEGQLFGMFAGIAVFIACLGLLGLAAFATERRTKEVGVRKALGASAFDVLKLFLWQFTVPVLLANLIAWPLAFALMHRWLQGFAYRIDLTVWPFALATVAAVLIAWLTVSAQAFKAASRRPVEALRYE